MKKSFLYLFLCSALLFSISCNQAKKHSHKSTIDSTLQAFSEKELAENMKIHNASWGCLALMDVDSGAIKVLVNLDRDTATNTIKKAPDHASTKLINPGQLFTLVSLMACFRDKLINLGDSVEVGFGKSVFPADTMQDPAADRKHYSVEDAFRYSSNAAIAQFVYKSFRSNPKKFIDNINETGIGKALGLSGIAEPAPVIGDITPQSLPWMAIGYNVKFTPLQILAFYNAVANKGKLIRPLFVTADTMPCIIKEKICTLDVLEKAETLLKGTVLKGAMKEAAAPGMFAAGKGAIVKSFETKSENSTMMMCAGYFPADAPTYSFIVVLNCSDNTLTNWAPLTIRDIIGYLACGGKK